MACAAPAYWDADSKTCKQCPDTYVLNSDKNGCVCPADKPYVQDNKCIACSAPNYWNKDTSKCESCPDTYVLNKD